MESSEELLRVRSLSNEGLLLGLDHSLRASRRAVAEVVAYLGEVEERRLHLLGGYSSMFAYCSQRLGMSEDEAYRRIEVASSCRRFPRLFELLAAGQISLSVAALLKARLTKSNHEGLLAALCGKTVAQAREVLASWFPRPDVEPLLRKLPTRTAPAASAAPTASTRGAAPASAFEPAVASVATPPTASRGRDSADAVAAPALQPSKPVPAHSVPCHVKAAPSAASASRSIEPLSPGRYKLQLTVSSELKGKLELARDLLRHAVPSGDLATLIERGLDVLLEQTMKRRFARSSAAPRNAKPPAEPTVPAPAEAKAEPSAVAHSAAAHSAVAHSAVASSAVAHSAAAHSAAASSAVAHSAPPRHIPNPVRREVHARDDGRCTWLSPDGVRCNSRAWLEHDHVIPRARGGTHEATNIRGFCRSHNRLAAEQVYGKKTIARIIARKRRQRASDRDAAVASMKEIESGARAPSHDS